MPKKERQCDSVLLTPVVYGLALAVLVGFSIPYCSRHSARGKHMRGAVAMGLLYGASGAKDLTCHATGTGTYRQRPLKRLSRGQMVKAWGMD